MGRKFCNFWKKVFTAILAGLGITKLIACSKTAYVCMYGVPDPNYVAMYGVPNPRYSCTISGVVQSASNEKLSAIKVAVMENDVEIYSTITNENGHYLLNVPLDGEDGEQNFTITFPDTRQPKLYKDFSKTIKLSEKDSFTTENAVLEKTE